MASLSGSLWRRNRVLAEVLEVDALAKRYLSGRLLLFGRPSGDARALDGHGDLLATASSCLTTGRGCSIASSSTTGCAWAAAPGG